ncbi:MAG: YebC/PmpR family DNA-binding transcriptional regulator [Minisyncoccales bacterium]
MSGHSHFSSIKHKKAITDAKRGKIFSKIARQILIAVKEKGNDPETNSSLRLVIEKARSVNMPKDNIEKAIKRGTGSTEGEKLEEVIFEAYGPAGTAIIIEGITDNKNRTLGEIRQVLNQAGGKMAGEGSVKWMFERKGAITVNNEQKTINKEDLEMKVIEAGADDTYWHNGILDVYTKPEGLEKVKKNLEAQNIEIESASLDWVAKDMIELEEKDKQKIEKLFELLDENEAVQEIYSNIS